MDVNCGCFSPPRIAGEEISSWQEKQERPRKLDLWSVHLTSSRRKSVWSAFYYLDERVRRQLRKEGSEHFVLSIEWAVIPAVQQFPLAFRPGGVPSLSNFVRACCFSSCSCNALPFIACRSCASLYSGDSLTTFSCSVSRS